jgi:hypothetical protein
MKNDSPPWQEDPKNPTRRSGEKRKDKYGNEIKNVAKHLARKAMNAVKEAVNKNATEKEVRKPLNAKIIEHDNCGTPECCGQCDTAELDEALTRVTSGNKGYGYHGNVEARDDAEKDKRYSAMHRYAKKLVGDAGHLQDAKKPNVMVKHFLDSAHGRHIADNPTDKNITSRFAHFKKSYNPAMHEETEIDEGVTNPEIKKAYADLIKTPSGSSERKSAIRRYKSLRQNAVKEEVEGKVYSVHVKGDSKDHNSPEFKKHLKGWGGELHYASDKGAAYKFKKGYQATGFHHGVKSGFKSLDSEHDGHVNEETLTEISAKGVSARDEFRQKIQRAMSDPANLARAKKVIARKKAKAKEAAANEPKNLVHQLHKSQSINAKVKFYDGKEHEIAPNHHDKFMNKYHGLKSSIEKESLVKRAHKSHEDFLKAIHEEFADFSQEKPNTDSITPANYPTPPVRDDITDYNSDDRHDEYDMVAIENDVAAQIENSEWEDLVFYYDDEDLNYEDSDEDIAEGITPQGRLKKRFNMMRSKSRRNMARNLALKRVATPDRIKSRSVRAARNMVYSRVLRGRDRSTLSATEKTRIEGMVKRMAPMVGRLSLRLQQKERMIDRKRINNRNKRKKK